MTHCKTKYPIVWHLIVGLVLAPFVAFSPTTPVRAADRFAWKGKLADLDTGITNNLPPVNLQVSSQATNVTDDQVTYQLKWSWQPQTNPKLLGNHDQIQLQIYRALAISGTIDYNCDFEKWQAGYWRPEMGDKVYRVGAFINQAAYAYPGEGLPGSQIAPNLKTFGPSSYQYSLTLPKKDGEAEVGIWVSDVYNCQYVHSTIGDLITGSGFPETGTIASVAFTKIRLNTNPKNPDPQPTNPLLAPGETAPEILKPNQADVKYDKAGKKFIVPISWAEPRVIREGSTDDQKLSMAQRRDKYLVAGGQYTVLEQRLQGSQSVTGISFFNPVQTVSQTDPAATQLAWEKSVALNPGDSIKLAFAIQANFQKDPTVARPNVYSKIKVVTLAVDKDGNGTTTVENTDTRPTDSQTQQGQGGSPAQANQLACNCDKVPGKGFEAAIQRAFCETLCFISSGLGRLACFTLVNVVKPLFNISAGNTCNPDAADQTVKPSSSPSPSPTKATTPSPSKTTANPTPTKSSSTPTTSGPKATPK